MISSQIFSHKCIEHVEVWVLPLNRPSELGMYLVMGFSQQMQRCFSILKFLFSDSSNVGVSKLSTDTKTSKPLSTSLVLILHKGFNS